MFYHDFDGFIIFAAYLRLIFDDEEMSVRLYSINVNIYTDLKFSWFIMTVVHFIIAPITQVS